MEQVVIAIKATRREHAVLKALEDGRPKDIFDIAEDVFGFRELSDTHNLRVLFSRLNKKLGALGTIQLASHRHYRLILGNQEPCAACGGTGLQEARA